MRPQHSGRFDAVSGRCQMHAITGGIEHGQRRIEIFALEIAIEGIGKKHDLATVVSLRHARRWCAGIHVLRRLYRKPKTWMAGTSPAMTCGTVIANTSLRHLGSGRLRLKPVTHCDAHASPGTASRAFISHGTRAA